MITFILLLNVKPKIRCDRNLETKKNLIDNEFKCICALQTKANYMKYIYIRYFDIKIEKTRYFVS